MKRLLAGIVFSFFLSSGMALAGGGDFEDTPQQAVPQSKIIVNVPDDGNAWVIPVTVAVVGGIATIGAAYVARSRRKDK